MLLVNGSKELMDAVRYGVNRLEAIEVIPCGLAETSTRAAELRPFAIVMDGDLYAFDSAEFDALARDVGALC